MSYAASHAGAAVLPETSPRLRDDRFKHLDGQALAVANAAMAYLRRKNEFLQVAGND